MCLKRLYSGLGVLAHLLCLLVSAEDCPGEDKGGLLVVVGSLLELPEPW